MTGLSVCCWTGDSWGQRFNFSSAPSLSPDRLSVAQRKGLMRRTRKRRGIWQQQQQQPFPPHPEGQQSCSVAARGGKQGAHCDINTDRGGQVTPSVGVCHRDAHCEEEKGGGGEMWRSSKFRLNKRISIDKIGPACVSEAPKVSSYKLLVSDCNTINHVGGFHTLALCQILSQ